MNRNSLIAILLTLFVVLMSIPWLVPGAGWTALLGPVALLCAERVAALSQMKRSWVWFYCAFLAWNLITTWWVCKASVGGGLFASFYTAAMMSLIFGAFRLSRKAFSGAMPYIFLAAMWTAWERFLLTSSQISWPWLVLGNAFAGTTSLVQWYEYTGLLGGSVWIWAVGCGLFGILSSVAEGRWERTDRGSRIAALAAVTIVLAGPMTFSLIRHSTYDERSERGTLKAVAVQPNYDPWEGKHSLPQSEQTSRAIGLLESSVPERVQPSRYPDSTLLVLFPETFTSDILLDDPKASPTWRSFADFLSRCPNTGLVFGSVTRELFHTAAPPSLNARPYGDLGWYESHNTAFVTDDTGRYEKYHKSKLVVGSESLPYPKLLGGIDRKLGYVAGHYTTQKNRTPLHVVEYDSTGFVLGRVPVGVGICYESVYGEHLSGFAAAGAQAIAIITNDGWWGNTAGHRQHFNYSRLRAIETRRDIVRCANTGISAFIDQKGDVVSRSAWWKAQTLSGTLNLTDGRTFFVRHGDIVGRICVFVFALSLLAMIVRLITSRR